MAIKMQVAVVAAFSSLPIETELGQNVSVPLRDAEVLHVNSYHCELCGLFFVFNIICSVSIVCLWSVTICQRVVLLSSRNSRGAKQGSPSCSLPSTD